MSAALTLDMLAARVDGHVVGSCATRVDGHVVGSGATRVTGVRHDSREVEPGDLFVAIAGARCDGHAFVEQAIDHGAVAIVAEREAGARVPLLLVADARRALALLSEEVYGHPTSQLRVVGITGTNGKTTTAWLVETILAAVGARPGLLGTVQARGPGGRGGRGALPSGLHTTPEADDLARFARDLVSAGATHLVMEVSSHGLALDRVSAVRFEVAAFTNLTQDHLDFHGTLDAYGAAKARLFTELAPAHAVVNVDDSFGAALARRIPETTRLVRCSSHADTPAEIRAVERRFTRNGVTARVETPERSVDLVSPLVGAHNLENLTVALGVAVALGIDIASASTALRVARGAPGRLERVPTDEDIAVFVDYAHTPDALARVLAALRPHTAGRLVVVFGCGGDRDRGKRPLMGDVAARGADLVIVTSDNPRTESPRSIVSEIEPAVAACGLPRLEIAELSRVPSGFLVEIERERAIASAIAGAVAGDTVLIAGKGHEDYQIVGTERRPFDDREEAVRAIARRALTRRRRGRGEVG